MKKLLIIAFAVASLATAFTSCKKDVSEEELLKNQLAQADSLLKRGGVIKYTVKVVSTANSSMLKAKMSIENASVTVYQNDKVYTGQTDAMGFVTFDNMRVGTVAVNVTLKDHAEVDYVADITPQEQLSNLSQSQVVNTIRYASTMVPMFPIADPGCATITGKVTAELDLTNTTPEPAPGVKVTATVDVDDPDFVNRYIAPTLSSGTPSAGRILKYAFSYATITATTADDGTYIMKVPASLNGLPIKLSVVDYQAQQKLYLENNPTNGAFAPGEYTTRVYFIKNIPATEIPSVKPIYINISAPNCPVGKIYENPNLKFEINIDGTITKVRVINKGNFSNKPAIIAFPYGNGAILDALMNSDGSIDTILVINGGKNYKADGLGSFVKAFMVQNTQPLVYDYSISEYGTLSNVNITKNSIGYAYNPTVSIECLSKDAVKPIIEFIAQPWSTQNLQPIIINAGSNILNKCNTPNKKIDNANINEIIKIQSGNYYINNLYLGTGLR